MKKRLFALFLALALVAPCLVSGAAAANESFTLDFVTEQDSYDEGDSFTVTLLLRTDAPYSLYSFETAFVYDAALLRLDSVDGIAEFFRVDDTPGSFGSGSLRRLNAAYHSMASPTSREAELTVAVYHFTALAGGTADLSFIHDYTTVAVNMASDRSITITDAAITLIGAPPPPTTYELSFDTAGGEGTLPGLEPQEEGAVLELPACALTRKGYGFTGWHDGLKTWQPGDSYTMPAHDVRFTAVWTPEKTSVTGANGQTVTAYTIFVSQTGQGAVSPGTASMEEGKDANYRFTPAEGWKLEDVRIDGVSVGPVEIYAFADVSGPHTVHAVFAADVWDNPFTDVVESDWFYQPVWWAARNGITTGTTDTTFSPGAPCTRGQIVTFLWRALGQPEPALQDSPFTDVTADDYFCKAVLWAYEQGITTGATDTTFSPGALCTRGQAVTFLWRAQGRPASVAAVAFRDVDAGAYYADAVRWAVEKSVVNGTSATAFSPQDNCTRGHIVTMLYRALA